LTSLLRHYRPDRAPAGFDLKTATRQFLSQTGALHTGERDAHDFEWRVLFVAGMWFQDLYNYDFRRTEMCIIPHGTPNGEISFCALNTGVGWRQIVERQNARASTGEWYQTHGRHPIYAGGKAIPLPARTGPATVREHELALREREQTRSSASPEAEPASGELAEAPTRAPSVPLDALPRAGEAACAGCPIASGCDRGWAEAR
jgi:hypothetical protein